MRIAIFHVDIVYDNSKRCDKRIRIEYFDKTNFNSIEDRIKGKHNNLICYKHICILVYGSIGTAC